MLIFLYVDQQAKENNSSSEEFESSNEILSYKKSADADDNSGSGM